MNDVKLKSTFGTHKDYVYRHERTDIDRFIVEQVEVQEYELFSPARDEVFKMLFSSYRNVEFTCFLFSLFINEDYDYIVENIKALPTIVNKKDIRQSNETCDSCYRLRDTVISLEMNNTNQMERNKEYADRFYALETEHSPLKKKKEENEKRKYLDVIQFNIQNFVFKGIDKTIEISYREDEDGVKSRIIYINIYLPLIKEKYTKYGVESLNEVERNILTIFIANEIEIKKLMKEDDNMLKRIINYLRSLKNDEKMLSRYEGENSQILASRMIGEAKGRDAALEDTATLMLKKGIDLNTVQECTKLPMDKIKNIMTML